MKRIYIIIFVFLFIISLCNGDSNHILLRLGNTFVDWLPLSVSKQNCSNDIICEFIRNSDNQTAETTGTIYNQGINRYRAYAHKNLNIDANLEPQQKWPRTYQITEGKDSYFQFAITYRLYYTKHNFAMSYFKDQTLDSFIETAKSSLKESSFSDRIDGAVAVYTQPYKYRNRFIDMIGRIMRVDRFGKAFGNTYAKDKFGILKKYKFCIAIESSIDSIKWGRMYSNEIDDYDVTEKLLDCMRAGAIPIYFGPRNARMYFPNKKSVIYSGDFETYEEFIRYIIKIKDNEKVLEEYISWPNSYSKKWYNRFQVDFLFTSCRLCAFVKHFYIDSGNDEDEIKFDANDNII